MGKIFRSFIRSWAFVSKEVVEVVRQPRLILTLVLGPFLILLLFGAGYQSTSRQLRTKVVVDDNSPFAAQVDAYAQKMDRAFIYLGHTSDEQAALNSLRQGQLDLVIVAPRDAYDTIRSNKQAEFSVYTNEVDPLQSAYIDYLSRLFSDQVNRRVLQSVAQEGQSASPQAQDALARARTANKALADALRRGDVVTARQQQKALNQDLDVIETALGAGAMVLRAVRESVDAGSAGDATASLAQARRGSTALSDIPSGSQNYNQQLQSSAQIDQDLAALEGEVSDFQNIQPQILVAPFTTKTQSIATVQPTLSNFYAPAVIVLLMQHLVLTFSALSIVRERRLGAMDLFRVSPLSAGETLVGKYIGYLLLGAFLAVSLTALLVGVLKVPMLGDWGAYAVIILLLMFFSLGWGFVLSLMAETESQAVQYSMILLLTSVFFSGFFLRLDNLWLPVRAVSYMLPATYGIPLLQSIMLRGNVQAPLLLAGMGALGLVTFALAWLVLSRRMALQR